MSTFLAPEGLSGMVERLDHAAMAVERIEDALPLVRFLGGEFFQGADHPRNQFRWVQFVVPGGGKIEFLAPLAETSFLRRYLDRRGEGFHHVTFKVTDLTEATTRARESGYVVTGLHRHQLWSEAFLHPKTAGGILIQLAEWQEPFPLDGTLDEVLAGEIIDPT